MINDFRGQYRWLSNFEYCTVKYNGITYPSSEHAYQAQKDLSEDFRKAIAKLPTCKQAKAYGYKANLRRDWEEVKYNIMYDIVLAKFTQNPDLAEKLLATESETLVEGNTWGDTYWGVCNGKGENNLGKILMKVRNHLRNKNV